MVPFFPLQMYMQDNTFFSTSEISSVSQSSVAVQPGFGRTGFLATRLNVRDGFFNCDLFISQTSIYVLK